MFHWFSIIQNTRGDVLPGWQVECVELADGQTVVPIFADENGTPIASVSSVTNRAVADESGNYSFFVPSGNYSLRFYNSAGVFQRLQRYIPMYGADAANTENLASNDAGKGAALVGVEGSGTVQDALDARPTSAALAAPTGSSLSGFQQSGAGAVVRTVQDRLRQTVSVKDFGAVGDGVADDTAALSNANFAANGKPLLVNDGTYNITSASLVAGGAIIGTGTQSSILKRTGSSSLLSGLNRLGDNVEGVTLNLDRATLGNVSGHGVSVSGQRLTFRDIIVRDYGSNGTGGGTGILVVPGATYPNPKNIRLADCDFFPDPAAAITVGWLFEDSNYCFASRIYSESVVGGIGYAHELKNNANYNSLSQLIASDSNVALAYGQETVGPIGASFNIATGVIASACDVGWLSSKGSDNITLGLLHDPTGSPDNTTKYAVRLSGEGGNRNYAGPVFSRGVNAFTVSLNSQDNAVEVLAHDTQTNIVEFTASARKNMVRVIHPGQRTSVLNAVTDNSGQSLTGPNANVVRSELTGERIGSVSGRFWDKLGDGGITPPSSHRWVCESDQFAIKGFVTPGNSGDISGLAVTTARDGLTEGSVFHVTGATRADNYWSFTVGGTTGVMRLYNEGFRHGATGPRWLSGVGSPEGVTSAPVGSFYSRSDGGAGTSFYVKESGTGNTGWVAK